jgi:hypothetical protein
VAFFSLILSGTAQKLQTHLSSLFISRTLAVSCFILCSIKGIAHQDSMNPFKGLISNYLTPTLMEQSVLHVEPN